MKLIKLAFKQYEFMPIWVGGAIVVTLELLGLLNIPNFIGIWLNLWESHPEWQSYFMGAFVVFIACAVGAFGIVALTYYKLIVHARQKYQQTQVQRESRNPAFRKLVDIEKMLIRVEKAVKRVEKKGSK